MKMTAALRVVAWAAWAALASAQATQPSSDQVPVPAGWHVVAFTKGADPSPESGAALNASPEQAALNALSAEPDKAARAPEAEEADAHEAEAGQQDSSLAEALGNLQPYAPPQPEAAAAEAAQPAAASAQPAKPLAATKEVTNIEPPQPSASSDQAASSGQNVDGIPIPAGYRVEGFTPGAGSPAAVLPPAEVPPPSATPPLPSAAQPVAAAVIDVVPKTKGVASQPAPASSAQDLKVDGLDVPAGWQITSVIGDDSQAAVDSSPPPATAKAAAAAVSSQPPATAKAVVAKAKVSPMPMVATAAVSVKKEHKPSYHFQGIAQETLKATVAAMAAAASVPSEPRNSVVATSDIGAMAAAPPLTEAAVDSAISYATGQQGQVAAPFVAPETLQHITSVECLTQTIDNDGRPCDGSKAPTAVASQIAPKGILDSLASGAQQLMSQMGLFGSHVDIKPALRKTMLTKGSAGAVQEIAQVVPQLAEASVQKQAPLLTKAAAHPVQAITQIAAQEPPQFGTADAEPMEVHPRLRQHREDHVTKVEDKRYAHPNIRVVQHNKVQQVEEKPAAQKVSREVHEHKKVRVAHVEEQTVSPDRSMADLVSSSD